MRSARYLLLLLPLLTQAQAGDNIAPAAPASTSAAVRALEAELAEAGAAGPPPAFVYLVTRLKLTGTDLTQVVFFSHSAIRTLDDCETERNAGLTSGWQYFSRYYLKTLKGISYEVDYRCVGSERQLAPGARARRRTTTTWCRPATVGSRSGPSPTSSPAATRCAR